MTQSVVSQDLLGLLVCPVTHRPLRQDGDGLIADDDALPSLRYPIRDSIPVLLAEEAELPEGVESLDAFREQFGEVDAS
jgi:uncharacterized protein YbaR (Trm112 family)